MSHCEPGTCQQASCLRFGKQLYGLKNMPFYYITEWTKTQHNIGLTLAELQTSMSMKFSIGAYSS
jgi:hypothetical protein